MWRNPRSAYEENFVLHGENYRQRKYIEKLESDPHLEKMRADYEALLAKKDRAITRARKETQKYHDLWQNTVRQLREARVEAWLSDDNYRCREYLKEIAALKEQLDKALADLEEANGLIQKLKAQMNRDHENSSIPSSKERFPKKVRNSRVRTGRRPGAQPDHPGHKRPHLEPTSPPVTIPVPDHILKDPDYYLTGKIITKQVLDIDITVTVTQYSTPEYRNRVTGTRSHAPFPEGICNETSYGPNVKALAFLLNNYCNVAIDKTSEIISSITSGRISLSRGLINSLPKQFSDKSAADRQKIFDRLLLAPAMYSDFTPARVNGKTVQVNVCANEDEFLYSFREHKGHEGIKDTPAEQYHQVLIHDHDKTFYNYGDGHQECLAHVLRYLQDSIENEPDLSWNKSMKDLLSEAIHLVKEYDRHPPDDQISVIEARYDLIIKAGEDDYLEHPPSRYYPDGFNLWKRMKEYRENHLLFLRCPDIGYTNNLSERALRKFKRKQHQAVTFRCNESVAWLCDALSIIETNRVYNPDIFDITKAVFSR